MIIEFRAGVRPKGRAEHRRRLANRASPGLSGTVMVLPREGLKDENGEPLKYDRIYYVGEYEFYIPRDENGKFKKFDSLGDNYDETLKAMRGLIPTHVVFNGKVGALTGDNAMKANATRKTELLIRINATAWQG